MTWFTYVYYNPLKPSRLYQIGYEPFYVGKGMEDRHLAHLSTSNLKNDRNRHKINTIKQIFQKGYEPIIVKGAETCNEQHAYDEEVRLIALYGRADMGAGPLTNMTDGGEGKSRAVITDRTKNLLSTKTSAAHTAGKLRSNSAAWSAAGLLAIRLPAARTKSAEARTGLTRSRETCQRISAARVNFLTSLNNEQRRAILSTMLGKHHTEHARNKSRDNNPRTMRVEVMGIIYPSLNTAVKATGINKPKLKIHPTFKVLT